MIQILQLQTDANKTEWRTFGQTISEQIAEHPEFLGIFWWWSKFPDLSTLDYFLRENLKDSVIANNLQIIDVLKNNIQNEIARNPREKLDTVITNLIVWAATIIQCQGASIEHNIIIELCSQTVGVQGKLSTHENSMSVTLAYEKVENYSFQYRLTLWQMETFFWTTLCINGQKYYLQQSAVAGVQG